MAVSQALWSDSVQASEILTMHFGNEAPSPLARTRGDNVQRVVNPSTGTPLAEVPVLGSHEIEAVVGAAELAQLKWAAIPLVERVATIDSMMTDLLANSEQFSLLEAVDSGNPLRACRADILDLAGKFRHWAAMAETLPLRRYGWEGPDLHVDAPVPVGIVLRITAFNKPLYFGVGGALMPLLMGNAVIIKPAPQSPLSCLAFERLAARHLPEGLVSVVTGGVETGVEAVRNPRIRRIVFTGSTATGLAVQSVCAQSGVVKSLSMELGGKNAMIVSRHVDVERVARRLIAGASLRTTQGQSCQAISRVLVASEVHDELLDAFSSELRGLRIGAACSEETDMGPLVSAEQVRRVRDLAEDAISRGALRAYDESEIQIPTEGYFQAPILLKDVVPEAPIAQEEVFGPVVTFTGIADMKEAVRIANEVRYGLTASVFSNDFDEALWVGQQLDAGYVWINDVAQHYLGSGFGGFKDSGVGREESVEAMLSFVEGRVLHIGVEAPTAS